jgi:hypothetical protein
MTEVEPLYLELKTISEPNARGHWAKRAARAKAQRRKAHAMAAPRAAAVGLPVAVTLTRIAPSNGLDDDNLRGALKAVRDGVADALQVDDRDPRVTWRYGQQRGKEYGVMVEMEPA